MPEGCICHACVSSETHDQARHDEGAVTDSVDLGDARADGGTETRRNRAMLEMTGETSSAATVRARLRHLESVDRLHARKFIAVSSPD